jgi:hypothetical protein
VQGSGGEGSGVKLLRGVWLSVTDPNIAHYRRALLSGVDEIFRRGLSMPDRQAAFLNLIEFTASDYPSFLREAPHCPPFSQVYLSH